ncbi:hypothetical protein BH11PSE7_BH11PSE7_23270 [soil metagenome]
MSRSGFVELPEASSVTGRPGGIAPTDIAPAGVAAQSVPHPAQQDVRVHFESVEPDAVAGNNAALHAQGARKARCARLTGMLGATGGFLAAGGAGYGLYVVAGAAVASLPVALAAGVGLGIAGSIFGAGLGGGVIGESSYPVPYGPGSQNTTTAENGEVLGPPPDVQAFLNAVETASEFRKQAAQQTGHQAAVHERGLVTADDVEGSARKALKEAVAGAGLQPGNAERLIKHIHKLAGNRAADPAWVQRTAAALILNGVHDVEDTVETGTVVRYGLNTLYEEGLKRDYARGAGATLAGYAPSFGVSSTIGGESRDALRTGAGYPLYVLTATSVVVGFGGEVPLGAGLGGLRYTKPPTQAQKDAGWHTAKQALSYWPFGVFHTALDVGAMLATDISQFNIGYWRVGTGAAAAATTGAVRARIDMSAAEFVPVWVDADNALAPVLINNLRQSTCVATSGWLGQLKKNFVSGTELAAPAARVIPARGVVRSLFAAACLAPRTVGGDSVLNAGLGHYVPEQFDTERFLMMVGTNIGLGLWDAQVRTTAALWPAPAPVARTPEGGVVMHFRRKPAEGKHDAQARQSSRRQP